MDDDRAGSSAHAQWTHLRDLSLEQLELLVLAKKKERTERRVRRMLLAQRALALRDDFVPREPGTPLRPPEGWRGQGGADSHLWAETLEPLAVTGVAAATRERARAVRRGSALLFVELALLLSFVVVIGLTFERMQALNREVRSLRQMAPPTPPAPVRYLPGVRPMLRPGEGAADEPAEATPPSAMVWPPATSSWPAESLVATDTDLLPEMTPPPFAAWPMPADEHSQNATPATPPAGASSIAQRLVIASIGVDAPVVAGDDWEALKNGIGQHLGSANPGESGNMVVSAHNDIYGEIFRDLDQVQRGDEVLVYTADRTFRYIVSSVERVAPTAVEVMDPTDYPALTMITCYPYLVDTQRVVVRAELAP